MSQRDSKGKFTKAKPRALQVGDRVRGHVGRDGCGPIMEGVVLGVDGEGDIRFRSDGDPRSLTRWAHPSNLILLEPAPQPKGEENGTLFVVCRKCGRKCFTAADHQNHACTGAKEDIRARFDSFLRRMEEIFPEAGDRTELLDCAAQAKAEIATLKAEVERLGIELNRAVASREGWAKEAELHKLKLQAAEAKLADIKAIIRTFKIMNNLPGEPGFTDAVNAVLDGAA